MTAQEKTSNKQNNEPVEMQGLLHELPAAIQT